MLVAVAGAAGVVGLAGAGDRETWRSQSIDCATFKADRSVWQWRLTGYELPARLRRPVERQFAGVVRCKRLIGLTERQIGQRFATVWSAVPAVGVPARLVLSGALSLDLTFDARGRVKAARPVSTTKPSVDLPAVDCGDYRFNPQAWQPGVASDDPARDGYLRELAGVTTCGPLVGKTPRQLARMFPGGGRSDAGGMMWLAGSGSLNPYLTVHLDPETHAAYEATASAAGR